MLKKLVKYGNSTALVLDKAILELLDMTEGSVVKISTDGKSLILTPQKNVPSKQIKETYTSEEANLDVMTKNTAKHYNLSENDSPEMKRIYKAYRELSLELSKDPEYLKKVYDLKLSNSEMS